MRWERRADEIDLKFQPLLKHADDLLLYKVHRQKSRIQNGLAATFMPNRSSRTTARECIRTSRSGKTDRP
jgi:hypothetical protein